MSGDSAGAGDTEPDADDEDRSRFNDVSEVELPSYVTEYLDDGVTVIFSENSDRNRTVAYEQFALYLNERDITFLDVNRGRRTISPGASGRTRISRSCRGRIYSGSPTEQSNESTRLTSTTARPSVTR